MPRQLCTLFDASFEKDYPELWRDCSVVVGMHPDQVTYWPIAQSGEECPLHAKPVPYTSPYTAPSTSHNLHGLAPPLTCTARTA